MEAVATERPETIDYLCSLPYEQYLQSKHWRVKVRPPALERARYRCQLCGKDPGSPPLEVHHNNYARLGQELPSDVIALCDACHRKHHTEPFFTTYTGMVCPGCGTEFVAELSIIHRVEQ